MKFILIDDDEVFLDLHADVVSESGLYSNPLKFAWAKDALEYLLTDNIKHPNQVYFLLLDINMPKMDGWELLDALNLTPLASKIMVAMVTSSINQQDKDRAKEYHQVVKYIEKPLKAELIITWLRV